MKKHSVTALLLLLFLSGISFAEIDWTTRFEKSKGTETPRYQETIDFCRQLAEHSDWMYFTSFGTSPQGRDLPLLIIDKDGQFSPVPAEKRRKAVVLIQAGIHSGEIDGKDAMFLLLRDLVVQGKYKELFENTTVLFIPIFNVDGHERFGPFNRANQIGPKEMGWRTTAQNLNLNRDFLKADAPEMQHWLRLFSKWLPDFLVDIHVTDGADYQYVLTYGLETSANMPEPLRTFAASRFEPTLLKQMAAQGYPMHSYVMFRNWNDIFSGLRAGAASPRYSTGYGLVQNRIFFLVETHSLKNYRTRVLATRTLLQEILGFVNQNASEILKINLETDQRTAEQLAGRFMPINLTYSRRDSIWTDFAGVELEKKPSEISGMDWVIYHPEKPKTYRLKYFSKIIITDSVKVPYAYIVPPQWQEEIERMKLHGVEIKYLTEEITLPVYGYRFSEPKWAQTPFEGRFRVEAKTSLIKETRTFPKNSAVILLNQRTNRVIVHLLEPKAPDSFLSWGFWNQIFEQKEYAEAYTLEQLARQMLKDNPALQKEFEAKLQADSAFAANPYQRLYFFYKHSPYWDHEKDHYPVSILYEPADLPLQ
ncbi:MAG: M14 family metallopeptidase [Calditrichia bacterium]